MVIDLGRFFGSKFRAGVLYSVFEPTNNKTALEESLKAYKTARATWSKIADFGGKVYEPDITVGENPWLRGHWLDRLPAMDEDIANMAKKLESYSGTSVSDDKIKALIQEALGKPKRSLVACVHNKPGNFVGGQPINLEFTFEQAPLAATLYYRHVNQGERYRKVALKRQGRSGTAAIPGEYTNSPYPLEYNLEVKVSETTATVYPGFNADLTNQPYWVVRKA